MSQARQLCEPPPQKSSKSWQRSPDAEAAPCDCMAPPGKLCPQGPRTPPILETTCQSQSRQLIFAQPETLRRPVVTTFPTSATQHRTAPQFHCHLHHVPKIERRMEVAQKTRELSGVEGRIHLTARHSCLLLETADCARGKLVLIQAHDTERSEGCRLGAVPHDGNLGLTTLCQFLFSVPRHQSSTASTERLFDSIASSSANHHSSRGLGPRPLPWEQIHCGICYTGAVSRPSTKQADLCSCARC